MKTSIIILCFILLSSLTTVYAVRIDSLQTPSVVMNDSLIHCRSEKFAPKQLAIPAGLLALGTWGMLNPWGKNLRVKLKNQLARWRNGMYIHQDDYIQYLPTLGYLTGSYWGLQGHHTLAERTVALGTSYVFMGVIVNALKYTTREQRPDGTSYNSFPSGHTATAFMGVELFRLEYGNRWGIPAYLLATTVGFLRLHNERHWLNDVIAGAGIGIASAKAGYWLLPYTRRLFRLKHGSAMTFYPQFYPYSQSWGIGLAATF